MALNKSSFVLCVALVLLASLPAMAESKGTLTLALDRTIFVNGTEVHPGQIEIAWQSHSPETSVTVKGIGKVVVQVEAKMVESDTVSRYAGIVTSKDADGREVLKQVRFQGKKTVLVFE